MSDEQMVEQIEQTVTQDVVEQTGLQCMVIVVLSLSVFLYSSCCSFSFLLTSVVVSQMKKGGASLRGGRRMAKKNQNWYAG